MKRYLKRQEVVEAVQLNVENSDEIQDFTDGGVVREDGKWHYALSYDDFKDGDWLVKKDDGTTQLMFKEDFERNYYEERVGF